MREGILHGRLPLDSCRLVILQYCLNDLAENRTWAKQVLAGQKIKPRFDEAQYRNAQVSTLAKKSYAPFKYIFELGGHAFRFLLLPPVRYNPDLLDKALPTVSHSPDFFSSISLIRRIYKGNILVISTSGEKKRDVEFIELARQYASKKSEPNLYFLDTTRELEAHDNYVIDGHNTASDHRKIAEQINRVIVANNLL